MKKRIKTNGQYYIIEKDGGYWYLRVKDTLIIAKNLREMAKQLKSI